MKQTFKILTLCLLTLIISTPQTQAQSLRETLRTQVKVWSMEKMLEIFEVYHDEKHGPDWLKERDSFTTNGCNTYLKALDDYRIPTLIKRLDSRITPTIWKRNKRKDGIAQITITKERQNKATGAYIWKIEVPLMLHVKRSLIEKRYKFLAIVEIKQTPHGKTPFIIDTWHVLNVWHKRFYRPQTEYGRRPRNPEKRNQYTGSVHIKSNTECLTPPDQENKEMQENLQ